MARFGNGRGCLLALTLVLAAGCNASHPAGRPGSAAADAKPSPRKTPPAPVISSELLASAHAHYGAAVIHEMNGETAEALDDFVQAAQADPASEELTLEVTERLVQNGQTERALALLTNATARAQASGDVYGQLGAIYTLLQKRDLAIQADETAVKKLPQSLIGYRNLFAVYLQGKQYDDAHTSLDRALKQPDTNAGFLIDLADLYLTFARQVPSRAAESRRDALAALERAVKLKPTDPDACLRLADGLDALDQPDQASPIYLELLRKYPDSPEVQTGIRTKLINIFLRGKDRARATEQLEAVVRDDPSDARAYYLLGSLAYEDRKLDQAAEYYAKVILFSPGFEQAYYDLATAQIGSNHAREALATLQKARAKFGDNFVVEFYSGVAYRADKQYDQAIKAFTSAEVIAQATDRARLNEFFYFQLGSVYERKGDIEPAVKYFEKAIEVAPDFAEALNYLGYLWAERGENLERARTLIEKAVKLEPKNAAYLDSLGWVLFKLGQLPEALDYLQKAIELSEEPDATIYDHLGDVQAALKQPDQAREAWRKSLALEPNDKIAKKLEPAPAN